MHPKYKRKAAKAKAAARKGVTTGTEDRSLEARKFPGLSMPDQEWRPSEHYATTKLETEPLRSNASLSETRRGVIDKEIDPPQRRDRPTAEDFLDGEPSAKRIRYVEQQSSDTSRRPYGPGADQREARNGYGAPSYRISRELDERPVLYKIYDGTVNGVRDFGAFVGLDGVKGRVEGKLLHWPELVVF